MHFGVYLKHHKNKLLAVGLVSLALAAFVAGLFLYYTVIPFDSSASNFLDLLYFIFEGGILAYLLFTNVRNDARAYHAILMWIFWFFLEKIETLFFSRSSLVAVFQPGVDPLWASLFIFYIALVASSLGLGIALYIFVRRYMFSNQTPFSRIRLFAILYAGVSGATLVLDLVITRHFQGEIYLNSGILFLLCRFLADVAICFTLERLKR